MNSRNKNSDTDIRVNTHKYTKGVEKQKYKAAAATTAANDGEPKPDFSSWQSLFSASPFLRLIFFRFGSFVRSFIMVFLVYVLFFFIRHSYSRSVHEVCRYFFRACNFIHCHSVSM